MPSPDINTNPTVNKDFEITLTLFRDRFARFKEDRTATLGRIAEAICRTQKERKEDLPLLKLAVFGDMRSDKGSLRWDNNLVAATGCELDYDGGKATFDDAREMLLAAGICAILYTTPSHTDEHPRWRVLAPFSQRLKPADRTQMLGRLNGVLGGIANVESFTLSQSYYYGYVSEPPRVDVIEGSWINLRDELDAGAIGKTGGKSKGNGEDTERHEFTEMEVLIARIVSGEALHTSVASIAGKCAARGDAQETCVDIVGFAFEHARQDRYTDKRWQETLRTINDIYTKEESKRSPGHPDNKTQPAPGESAPQDQPEFPQGVTEADFFYDLEKGDYIYTALMTHWPAKSLNTHLPKINGVRPARWLAQNKPVHQKVWAPGFPQIIEGKHLLDGGEWLGKDGVFSINSYVPPRIQPGNPKAAGPWLDLVTKLFPKEMEHTHLLDTLAFKLQNPAVKINHMIIAGGSKRIGKDTILEPFKRGVGYRNVAVVSPTTIMTEFNKYAQSLVLHISEARDLGETKKTTFAEKLKGLIATPPHVITINDKHKTAYTVLNCCLVIATTNHRTDSLYVTEDDGRYFPIWSEVEKESFEPTFFAELYDWMDNGGDAHAIACLLARDVSAYKPKALPPVTDLFLEMVDQSRPVEFDWVREAITRQGNHPVLTLEALADHGADIAAKQFLADRSKRKFVAFLLEQHGYTRVPCPTTQDKRWKTPGGGWITVYGLRKFTSKERDRLARELVGR